MKESTSQYAFQPYVEIIKGRVHNLKEVSLKIPHHQLIVVTGVSGSGKSSLTYDLLYAEANRRYMSTLESAFLRNFVDSLERPDVEQVNGLQAVIGIGQEISSSRLPRSTVGTLTDIYAFFRLLYARISDAYSYLTGEKMSRHSDAEMLSFMIKHFAGKSTSFLAPLVTFRKGSYKQLLAKLRKKKFKHVIINGEKRSIEPGMELDRYKDHNIELILAEGVVISTKNKEKCKTLMQEALTLGKGSFALLDVGSNKPHYFSRDFMDAKTGLSYKVPEPDSFSFNSFHSSCPACQGLGTISSVNKSAFIPNPSLSIMERGIPLLGKFKYSQLFKDIEVFLKEHGYSLHTPIANIPDDIVDNLINGTAEEERNKVRSPRLGQKLRRKMIWKGNRSNIPIIETSRCPNCQGKRLNKEALHFKVMGLSIADISDMTLDHLYKWLRELPNYLDEKKQIIAKNVLTEVQKRIELLLDIGLGYLTLNRPLNNLSGGEIRRLRIAGQVGTEKRHLVGIMYILDEPSIGLHPRDNQKLIPVLKRLRDLGNTVVVVEHDKEIMLNADYLIEMGPGSGQQGGEVVAMGPLKEFLAQPSVTASFLNHKATIPTPSKRNKGNGKCLTLKGCSGRSLKSVDLTIPLGKFIAITGVSGSGKSTLIHDTLFPILKANLKQDHKAPLPYKSITGTEHINKAIEITQTPIGRSLRSNVVTYIQLFELIRDLFTELPQAKMQGYRSSLFSFNVKGGRCETCKGVGMQSIEMDLLPSVQILCPTCQGYRYKREVLDIRYKGNSIADILKMSVKEALAFFAHHPKIHEKLKTLNAIGLGYIELGTHAPNLSGGEAQRIKLARELAKKDSGQTLYILDEPTTGLHFQDIIHILEVLQQLVKKGNTVICIEHNLDLIKSADHIIDIGPEADEQGGYIVAEGTPEAVAAKPESPLAKYLQQALDGY